MFSKDLHEMVGEYFLEALWCPQRLLWSFLQPSSPTDLLPWDPLLHSTTLSLPVSSWPLQKTQRCPAPIKLMSGARSSFNQRIGGLIPGSWRSFCPQCMNGWVTCRVEELWVVMRLIIEIQVLSAYSHLKHQRYSGEVFIVHWNMMASPFGVQGLTSWLGPRITALEPHSFPLNLFWEWLSTLNAHQCVCVCACVSFCMCHILCISLKIQNNIDDLSTHRS